MTRFIKAVTILAFMSLIVGCGCKEIKSPPTFNLEVKSDCGFATYKVQLTETSNKKIKEQIKKFCREQLEDFKSKSEYEGIRMIDFTFFAEQEKVSDNTRINVKIASFSFREVNFAMEDITKNATDTWIHNVLGTW